MANRPNKNNLSESLNLLQKQTPNYCSVLKFPLEICVVYLVSDKARMATTPISLSYYAFLNIPFLLNTITYTCLSYSNHPASRDRGVSPLRLRNH